LFLRRVLKLLRELWPIELKPYKLLDVLFFSSPSVASLFSGDNGGAITMIFFFVAGV